MITGIIQTTKTNDGYTSYKISSTWYGADSKGPPRASEGEKVSFEAFDKPGKEGKVWPTIKLATFRKAASTAAAEPAAGGGGTAGTVQNYASKGTTGVAQQGRDSYWADKSAEDAKKDPRIVYQSSYDRAISFVDLAIRNGAFAALQKAKDTSKLEILQLFVDEQADRIMRQVYLATVPVAAPKAATPAAEVESDPEENWS